MAEARVYVVESSDPEKPVPPRLVRATHPSRALGYVVKKTWTARPATVPDVVALLVTTEIEDATGETE